MTTRGNLHAPRRNTEAPRFECTLGPRSSELNVANDSNAAKPWAGSKMPVCANILKSKNNTIVRLIPPERNPLATRWWCRFATPPFVLSFVLRHSQCHSRRLAHHRGHRAPKRKSVPIRAQNALTTVMRNFSDPIHDNTESPATETFLEITRNPFRFAFQTGTQHI